MTASEKSHPVRELAYIPQDWKSGNFTAENEEHQTGPQPAEAHTPGEDGGRIRAEVIA